MTWSMVGSVSLPPSVPPRLCPMPRGKSTPLMTLVRLRSRSVQRLEGARRISLSTVMLPSVRQGRADWRTVIPPWFIVSLGIASSSDP
jgi:hypothetical protein